MSFAFLSKFYGELASIESRGHAVIHTFLAHGVPPAVVEDGKAVLTDILAAAIPTFNGLVQVGEVALASKSPLAGLIVKAVADPVIMQAEDAAGAALAPSATPPAAVAQAAAMGVTPMSAAIPTIPAGG